MAESKYYSEDDFLNVKKVDAHVHMNTLHPYFNEVAKKNNFRLVSINTKVPGYPSLSSQQKIILDHKKQYAQNLFHLASFDTTGMQSPGWVKDTLKSIKKSFDNGARGIKVWKNIGMDLLRENGSFVMICDSEFHEIFEYLMMNKIPVLGHIGEPRNCWLPINEMTVSNDREYYSNHPEFHMYYHPEYPTHDELIKSRDRLLENYPDLIFIGAHLGSMEWNVDEIADRLDRYSNFFVDLTDRICHLQYQSRNNRSKVVDFFNTYQDRILYGTDLEYFDDDTRADIFKYSEETWKLDWKYFVTDEIVEVPAINASIKGLKLDRTIIDKIFRINAERCYQLT